MKLKYILSAVAFTGCCGSVNAQQLQSAYFLDGYAYGHELNPAKDYDRGGYVAFPFLGDVSVGSNGNLSLSDLLYPHNGQLVTYLHPSISTADALSNFDANNKLLEDMKLQLISVGFHAFRGYNTIGLSLRQNTGLNIPYDFFDLTKNLQNRDYKLSSFGATEQSFVEVSLGHSHEVYKGVRIGVKAKLLLGVERVDAKMNNLSLQLSDENRWIANADAQVNAYMKGLSWGAPARDEYSDGTPYEHIDFDNVEYDDSQAGPAGIGFGVDLGAEVDFGKLGLVKGLKASVAMNDIGSIKWNDGICAVNQGEPFVFDGFNDVQVSNGPGVPIEDQADDLGDRLEKLYCLKDGGSVAGDKTSLGSTLRVAAEYALPAYDRFSVGLLYTQRFQNQYGWNETRASLTISPLSWLEASANVGIGTFGTNFGWVFNLHPRGFNIFVGMDHIPTKLTKQYIPVNSNSSFSFGINFPFGQLQSKKHKKDQFDKLDQI